MATTNVYITGHGDWEAGHDSDAAPWGFFNLPNRCTVHFYIHNMKTMKPADVRTILRGEFTGEPESTFGPFRAVPQHGVGTLDDADRAGDLDAFRIGAANNRLPLPSLFYSPKRRDKDLKSVIEIVRKAHGYGEEYVFHYLCCRYLALAHTRKGGEIGMNAQEYLDREEYRLVERDAHGDIINHIKWIAIE